MVLRGLYSDFGDYMKIKVVKNWGEWSVQITQGCQTFHADFYGDRETTQEEAQYMARMFRTALKNHDAEVIEKYFKGNPR